MSTNRNYAKREEGQITFAPAAFVDANGVYHPSPTAADYLAAGWKRYTDAAPSDPAPDGYHYERDGWDETDDTIAVRWRTVTNPPPPPRTFSKLKLYAALSAANLWDVLKAWLEAQTYEGMNAWTAFSLAQELTEDHPMFAAWFSAAKTALGVDDATAEELLDAAAI